MPQEQSTLAYPNLARLAQRVYPNEPRKRLRFVLRSWFYADVMRRWLDYLSHAPELQRALAAHPWLIDRLHRPFLKANLTRAQRLAALSDHYAICRQIGWMPLFDALADKALRLACIQGRTREFWLDLTYTSRFGKEGEWTLHLAVENRRIYSAAFSFQDPAHPYLFIGCIQGPSGDGARDEVREITRDLHDARPRDLMLETIRQIAIRAGMDRVGIVRTREHVYRHPRSRFKKRNTKTAWKFDYDQWAQELEATATDRCWIIPAQGRHRDIDSLPSKKRAAARRRDAQRNAIRAQLQHALGEIIQPSPRDASPAAQRAD
ncbi:DUF535 family protein [Acidihalobacter ferrooxydans]|uniref:DUF535 domain-containing protein n=1 Tax=Acidihalobacter ferrooxydans TaxID=1765967 RepID=A0A1P8UJL0_9GAMM|nr:DUF535 family protein [Acidihalobacter ferrooxydans]APZ43974.1 hypothetical protein BW247_13460 [Acidihalobacter ferrooxydans]